MELRLVFCLLLFGNLSTAYCESLRTFWREKNIAILKCGKPTKGKVTWSRDVNGQRVDILTTRNGETTKHIADPGRRYSSGANLVLSIFRVSQSDAGRYYCNGAAVELTVVSRHTPATSATSRPAEGPTTEDTGILHVRQKEKNIALLKCGQLIKGNVTWSRDVSGQRVDILTTRNGETTKHIADPGRRYSAGANLVLSIFRVSQSDAGRYYCSGATVELTVTEEKSLWVIDENDIFTTVSPEDVNVVETVLMFVGAGLAALVLLLATVVAGTVIRQQAGQTGHTAERDTVELSPLGVSLYEHDQWNMPC